MSVQSTLSPIAPQLPVVHYPVHFVNVGWLGWFKEDSPLLYILQTALTTAEVYLKREEEVWNSFTELMDSLAGAFAALDDAMQSSQVQAGQSRSNEDKVRLGKIIYSVYEYLHDMTNWFVDPTPRLEFYHLVQTYQDFVEELSDNFSLGFEGAPTSVDMQYNLQQNGWHGDRTQVEHEAAVRDLAAFMRAARIDED
ncbi:hypothetical protein CVT24_008293 [Panaeolus cyanescens]|uniref:Uncharacterized protein n=1 Tax=Panaeolus cyanescens TaxID=181874 RepID=A0A409W0N7_9AGAR|nr:hypothetical protein CVT24_008293 [Panaeolus cyanescens]